MNANLPLNNGVGKSSSWLIFLIYGTRDCSYKLDDLFGSLQGSYCLCGSGCEAVTETHIQVIPELLLLESAVIMPCRKNHGSAQWRLVVGFHLKFWVDSDISLKQNLEWPWYCHSHRTLIVLERAKRTKMTEWFALEKKKVPVNWTIIRDCFPARWWFEHKPNYFLIPTAMMRKIWKQRNA